MASLFLIICGAVAAVDGIVVNLSQHGGAVQACLGLLGVYAAYRVVKRCGIRRT